MPKPIETALRELGKRLSLDPNTALSDLEAAGEGSIYQIEVKDGSGKKLIGFIHGTSAPMFYRRLSVSDCLELVKARIGKAS